MLSQKYYREIAAILATAKTDAQRIESVDASDSLSQVTRDLARYFKYDNPRFDSSKFYDAAAPERDDDLPGS